MSLTLRCIGSFNCRSALPTLITVFGPLSCVSKGHNKPITVLAVTEDRSRIFTGSHDGWVTTWDVASGVNDRIAGAGHGNQMNSMKVVGDRLYTCGIDDTLRIVDISSNTYTNEVVKLGSQPRGMDISNNRVFIATVKEVINEVCYEEQYKPMQSHPPTLTSRI